MRFIALYKTWDGGEFVDASLASIYEHCDHIVMVHSDVSWLGEHGNTVKAAAVAWCNDHDRAGKVHHVDVSLTGQEAQYAAGLDYIATHRLEHDAVLAVDADEIWEDQYFEMARQQMAQRPYPAYRCNMHTYLKTPFYRVHPPFGSPTVFFCDPQLLLKSPRGCQAPAVQLDKVWMHHYTYVRETRAAVERKLHQSCLADGGETVVQNWMTTVYDRMPAGKSLHAFVRWRDAWHKLEKIWLPDFPPAMRSAKLLSRWLPSTRLESSGFASLMDGEQNAIFRLAKDRKQAVDLGTYRGLSAVILGLACERVHTVDVYEDILSVSAVEEYHELHRQTGHSLEITAALCDRFGNMTCEQSDTAEAGRQWRGGPVDVLFVDADHSEQATRANIAAWLQKMEKKGLIILHDNNSIHPGVKQVVDEMQGDYRFTRVDPGEFSGSLAVFEVTK